MSTATESSVQQNYKEQFEGLSTDDKLAVLYYMYKGLGEETIEKPDDNKESDSSLELYNTLKGQSEDEQLQFMKDALSDANNDHSDEYNQLSNTTKTALWYRLAQGMDNDNIVDIPGDYELSGEAKELADKLQQIDFEQIYIVTRDFLLA